MSASVSSSLTGNVKPCFNSCKKTLLTEVETQLTTTDKKRLIHRLVYAAMTTQNSEVAITEYYRIYLSTLWKNTQADAVTGILLLYPNCIIHLIESSSEVLHMILKDLVDMESTDFPLKEVRILVLSHCVLRTFPSWCHHSVKVSLSLQDSTLLQQPVETLVTESLATIYKLCASLKDKKSKLGPEAQQQAFPLQDAVTTLCQSPVLCSPCKYLQTYTQPTNILMDSETVWPTQRRLYW
ncbi:hypothetical protein UPYG_G00135070 [Umbra pygmaea]|uniref:BLUF domain-containing protein n=1 Tax=Umbra pygmaea TaxID=75934 RepID=A0ABD0XCE4_UMBPY